MTEPFRCSAVCTLMPDRLLDPAAWLDLAAAGAEEHGIPLRYAPKLALVLFDDWRRRDPECEHYREHVDTDQLLGEVEQVSEWIAFAENFPDFPATPRGCLPDPLDELEQALREAAQ